jgi:hypothetical protein
MFLRAIRRNKDGKEHRYFSVVENRRVNGGLVVQRQVLYLGEINDNQQAAWRKTLEVFDDAEQRYSTLSLFPDDREVPAEAIDSIQVKLREMELRRARLWELLAGVSPVAAVGIGSVLARAVIDWRRARDGALGEGVGVARSEPLDRPRQ